jgi:hypothetical protein
MRNRLADELAGKPTHDDVEQLDTTLKPRDSELHQSLLGRERDEPDDDPYVRRLSFLIRILVASIESRRQHHPYWKT